MPVTLLYLLSLPLLAQTPVADFTTAPNFNSWLQYSGDFTLGGSPWSLRFESQLRRHDPIRKWQQIMARSGVNYQLNRRFTLSTAYHFLHSHRFGAQPANFIQDEHRLGHDLLHRTQVGRFAVTNRFRFENRWISLNVPPSPGRRIGRFYENRARYQTRITRPLTGTRYLTFYQEVFMPVPPESHPRSVDQFRIGLSLGRRIGTTLRAEFGYMYQGFWQRNGRFRDDNHTLVLSFWHTRTLRR